MSIGISKIGVNSTMNRILPEKVIEKSDMSIFNKDILLCWSTVHTTPTLLSEIRNQYLWHNTNITKPNGATLNSFRLSRIRIVYTKI